MTNTPPPPAGATWVDVDWQDGNRFFTGAEVEVGALSGRLTVGIAGSQHRSGRTLTNVRVCGDPPDLTPAQARQFARALMAAADRAEVVDGIA